MKSVDTATKILDLLSTFDEGMSISEVSKQMDLPLGTTHRFLKSLVENNMVFQDPRTKQYKLGLKVLSLAARMLNSNRLIEVARKPMRDAAEKLNNVVYISQENKEEVVCTYCVNPTETKTTFAAQIGNTMPFHAAAAGKVIFAHYPPKILRSLIRRNSPLQKFTQFTKTTEEEILKDSKVIEQRGYAVCDEELEPGVIAFAAPIFNYDGTVIASVAVTGIKANLSQELWISTILKCADQISSAMGHIK